MAVSDAVDPRGLERNGLALQVYDRLLERITDRQLDAGQRLNIYELARELCVSITPVREALARLSSQRLIRFEPYKGYSVLPLMDADRITQLFDVRIMIETHAVQNGVTRATPAQLDALQRTISNMRGLTTGDSYCQFRAFNDQDRSFHHILADTAANDYLADMYDALSPHIHIGRFYHGFGVIAVEQIVDEHLAIIKAYEHHDADRAQDRLRKHLLSARGRLINSYTGGQVAGRTGSLAEAN